MRAAGLIGANLLMLVVGLGLLPLLGAARSWRELVSRCGLAYLCGVVLVGIVSAHLALLAVDQGSTGGVAFHGLSLVVANDSGVAAMAFSWRSCCLWGCP